jgi:hypothetical protein
LKDEVGKPGIGPPRYLVYTTVGFTAVYMDIAAMLFTSIKSSLRQPTVDLAIMTSNAIYAHVPEETKSWLHFIPCPDVTSGVASSMQKLEIFRRFAGISEYAAILFLDADILVNIDLSLLLDSKLPLLGDGELGVYEEDRTFDEWKAKSEQDWISLPYFSLEERPYTTEQLDLIVHNGKRPFNAGLFLFRPSEIMRAQFESILSHISINTGQFFYEQSFLNYHFLLNNHSRSLFSSDVYIMYPDTRRSYEGIIHFSDAAYSPEHKRLAILQYCRRFAPHICSCAMPWERTNVIQL